MSHETDIELRTDFPLLSARIRKMGWSLGFALVWKKGLCLGKGHTGPFLS